MKLNSLHIKNFRSIKDSGEVEDITKIFALIGRNNAGKSSFLKSIQVLFGEIDVNEHDFHKRTNEEIEISGKIQKRSIEQPELIELKITCKKGEKPKYYVNDT